MGDGDEPVGRSAELGRIADFLAGPGGGRALVVEGDAGMGKTTVWRSALGRARAAGAQVLSAQPAEDELTLSPLGLHDLFAGIDVVPLVLAHDGDVFERGRAVLAALRDLAGTSAVVVAVDDVQWLDAPTSRALRYALRRLDDEPVRVLMTRRTGCAGPELVERERVEVVTLGPLSRDDLRRIVTPIAPTLAPPAMSAVHELSGGNPLHALELARDPDRVGESSLSRAITRRLLAAAPDVVAVVRDVAARGACAPEALAALHRRPALDGAIDGGLLTLTPELTVRPAHPLIGSLALESMAPEDRRRLHAGLAATAGDPDVRAHHLALASTERAAETAAELEEAADRAGRRGAPGAAAGFAAHSVRLTPLDDQTGLARRAVAEILHRAAAGETGRATAMVDALIASLPPGRSRIAALTLRVGLDFGRGDEVLARAEEEAPDELTRGRLRDLLAYAAYMYRGDLARARTLAGQAQEIARREGDAELEMLSTTTVATVDLLAGHPRPELMAHAVELGRASGTVRLGRWPEVELARQCVWAGDLRQARRLFERLSEMTARSGLEFQRPYRLVDLSNLELATGNLALAARLAEDGIESATDAGNQPVIAWLHYPAGLAAAHRGDVGGAATAIDAMRSWGSERGEPPRLLMAHHVAGVAALAGDDAGAARRELEAGLRIAEAAGQAHPGVVPVLPDALEAAVAAGAVARARELADLLDGQAAALALPWVDAAAERGRGLVALASGRPDGAVDALRAASAAFDALGYGLDAARALRWCAVASARAGSPATGRRLAADVGERFRRLGAHAWAARVDARSPHRFGSDDRRLVELVAAGRRNREIAGELHVSEASVEAALTRIYRSAGVRSRAELARRADDLLAPAAAGAETAAG